VPFLFLAWTAFSDQRGIAGLGLDRIGRRGNRLMECSQFLHLARLFHRRQLFQWLFDKLGIRDTVSLARLAAQHGVTEPSLMA
jgi:hypothetical protein